MNISTTDMLVSLKYNWTLHKKDAIEKGVRLNVEENAMNADTPIAEDVDYSDLEELDVFSMDENYDFESDMEIV